MYSSILWTLCSLVVVISAQTNNTGYIVRFHSARVAKENRRTWIDNQLNRASLPPLTDAQATSLKIGWESSVFDGFAGDITPEAVTAFKSHADVWYIESDPLAKVATAITQDNAPWGLQRISQRDPIQGGSASQTNFDYTFDDSAGRGVDIYIVDTGVRITHTDLAGRAEFGRSLGAGVPGQDIEGHGTHVAGIAAGTLHGVAKNARIVAVMNDDGTGSGSDIIAGINFAVQAAAGSGRPSVINLSITTPGSQAIDDAVENAISLGVHVVVAAGNENTDASLSSPARSSSVITVGATDINDNRASFSNFGPDVTVWAPGVSIISLGISDDNAVKTLDGTSMASPFVAGLVAYLLALEGNMSPAAMKQRIRALTTTSAIAGLPSNTTNVLVFNGEILKLSSAFPISDAYPADAAATSSNTPSQALQQSILGSVDDLVNAFAALAQAAQRSN
ncbi:hypothetical protein M408DRAFT_80385 [Serendipita vermifera MAFF 305830]|uniref:Peptidase S8/S53 domain-containing protein n=1 Tax=Serendipita vermifera MAFF 305830 TaxID=933852 RepID=A0A0C2WVW1_SERVB|nr:hypothetical protein M408DRAFT_80385 [Serendipita vermifera MAFF 305830]